MVLIGVKISVTALLKFEMQQVKGGSPYGSWTFAGDGSRQPSKLDLEQDFHQWKYLLALQRN